MTFTEFGPRAPGALLVVLALGACERDDAKKPIPSASTAPQQSKPLPSNLEAFAGWSEETSLEPGVRLLAPYRLRAAFAVTGPTGDLQVHFSQTARTCEEFLPQRPTSRLLKLADPNNRGLTILDASAERGVRARWSGGYGGICHEQPHGQRCQHDHTWEGSFTAAGCGSVDKPEAYLIETKVNTGSGLTLHVNQERFELTQAMLTDYYASPRKSPHDVPVAAAVLSQAPRLRVLEFSADDLQCLVGWSRWHARVKLTLDARDNSVLALHVRTETHAFGLPDRAIKFEFIGSPTEQPVHFRIDARGTQDGASFSLKGEGKAQRCN